MRMAALQQMDRNSRTSSGYGPVDARGSRGRSAVDGETVHKHVKLAPAGTPERLALESYVAEREATLAAEGALHVQVSSTICDHDCSSGLLQPNYCIALH